jgi:hypothetical protein
MEIRHVDVGQGDSTVVRTADEVVVVDTGDWPAEGESSASLRALGRTTTLLVDRVEAGVGVLVRESVTGPTGQALVAALPDGTTGGTVLTATVDGGAIRELRVDGGETARRRERAAGRLASLSRPLDDTR